MDRDFLNVRALSLLVALKGVHEDAQSIALKKMDFEAWARAIFHEDKKQAEEACDALDVALQEGRERVSRMGKGEDEGDDSAPDDFYASMWDDYSGGMHDDNAPDGAYQTCYWTDGIMIERTKVKGVWHYSTTQE